MIRWLTQGGVFSWAVLLVFLVGGFLALIRLVLARRVELPGLGALSAGLLLGLGLLGTHQGWMLAFQAVAFASVETKASLLQAGLDIGWYPTSLALVAAVVLAPLHLAAHAKARGRAATMVKVVGFGFGGLSLGLVGLALLSSFFLTSRFTTLQVQFGAGSEESAAQAAALMAQTIHIGLWTGIATSGLAALAGFCGGALLLVVGVFYAIKRRGEDDF